MTSIAAKEQQLLAAYERIYAREQEVGFDRLSRADQGFLAIWLLDAEVNNGGFSQWMFNSSGDHAELAVASLREIGAEAAAGVCDRFFALLPGGRPEGDRTIRQWQLDAAAALLGEDAFEHACEALEQEFYAQEDELRDRLWESRRTAASTSTLIEIVANLGTCDPQATIYAAKPWTCDSLVVVTPEPAGGGLPPEAEARGTVYFIEVNLAQELLADWVHAESRPTSAREQCERLIQYATYDA